MSDRKTGFAVSWIVNRMHVGESYRDVALEFDRRCAENAEPPITGRDRSRAITDALIQHRRNRADYAWVMGPH